jgi:hypothetical protein
MLQREVLEQTYNESSTAVLDAVIHTPWNLDSSVNLSHTTAGTCSKRVRTQIAETPHCRRGGGAEA